MTCGEKIKRIRKFRGLTQKELGILAGLGEQNANIRIAQYEADSRLPRRDLLNRIAQALNVNPINFYSHVSGCAEDIMQTLFWLEESNPGSVNLFQMMPNPGKVNASQDTTVRYNDTDDWPAEPPVGVYFHFSFATGFMKEWLLRQQELRSGKITRDEYFEWKINWPYTCDDGKESKYYIPWQKNED